MADTLSAQLDLDKDFNDATEDDEPEKREARFRTGCRRGNELTGTDQGAGENEPRANTPENAGEALGWALCSYRLIGCHTAG